MTSTQEILTLVLTIAGVPALISIIMVVLMAQSPNRTQRNTKTHTSKLLPLAALILALSSCAEQKEYKYIEEPLAPTDLMVFPSGATSFNIELRSDYENTILFVLRPSGSMSVPDQVQSFIGAPMFEQEKNRFVYFGFCGWNLKLIKRQSGDLWQLIYWR